MLILENLKWIFYQVYAPIRYYGIRKKRRLRDIGKDRNDIKELTKWALRRPRIMPNEDDLEAVRKKLSRAGDELARRRLRRMPGRRTNDTGPKIKIVDDFSDIWDSRR